MRAVLICTSFSAPGLRGHAGVALARGLIARQEALYAFSVSTSPVWTFPREVGRDDMDPVEAAAGNVRRIELAEEFSIGAINNPDHIVHDVRDIDQPLIGRRAPCRRLSRGRTGLRVQ